MNKLLSMCIMTSLLASPAWGSVKEAAFASSSDKQAVQTSMFAGATYRVGLDRRTSEPAGRASLRISGMTQSPGTSDLKFGQGLEISRGQSGRPALFMAGQDVGQLKNKAQLSGTTTALIVVGVVVVLGVAALVAADQLRDPCAHKECE